MGDYRVTEVTTRYLVIKVQDRPKGRKTDTWTVTGFGNGYLLGHIKWWPHWRQYCFFPEPDTVLAHSCLVDIQLFIFQLMAERKEAKG